MSIVDLAVKLGKAFEGSYSSLIKNDEMKTTITQEARTGVYTVPGHKMEEILEHRPMDYL